MIGKITFTPASKQGCRPAARWMDILAGQKGEAAAFA